jgi:hypothetical integral membrane protein (TIGR02206 family)
MPTGNAEFHVLDSQHIVTLAVIAGACLLVAFNARSECTRRWLGPLLGCLMAGYAATFYIQQAAAHSLTWQYSLPLELCNLVLISCILSLFRSRRFLTEIAYFWGLGGVLQAMATPDLSSGFPSFDFIMFFWSHGATLLAIVFLVSDGRFRPRGRSVVNMMIALNAYGLVIGMLDRAMGWNYGFLCRKPSRPSLFDVLGPWPWYLLSVEMIAVVTFLLLYLPWHLSARMRKQGSAATVDNS